MVLTTAQDSNHFFCGVDWGDASGNVRKCAFMRCKLFVVLAHSSPHICCALVYQIS